MSIPVKALELIPLSLTMTSGETDKVVKATVYKFSDNVIVGTQVTLTHQQNGTYKNKSIPYPAAENELYAQYLIFDNDGTTPNSNGDKISVDVFTLESATADVSITDSVISGVIKENEELFGTVSDEDSILGSSIVDEISGSVESNDSIDGVVTFDDLSGQI